MATRHRIGLLVGTLLWVGAGSLILPGAALALSTDEAAQSDGAVTAQSASAASAQSAGEEAREQAQAAALRTASASPPERRDLDFLFYGGKFVDKTFRSVIFRGETDYLPSYIWVAGLNYKLGQLVGPFTIETEGQLGRHSGIQDNWEVNALVIARIEWVWQNAFSFSVAVGDGFSLASEKPILEVKENPSTNVFLQYLLAEIVFGLPSVSWHPRFMIRVHHRSGAFGIHCAGTCGSNFVTYGLKGAF